MLKIKKIYAILALTACLFATPGIFQNTAYADNELESQEPESSEENESNENDEDTDDDYGISIDIEENDAVDLEQAEIVNNEDLINEGFEFDIEVGGDPNSPEDNMRTVLNGLFVILTGAASVLLIFGLGKLFLSFREDKPEEKVTAGMFIMGSIMTFSIRAIIDKVIENGG